VPVLDTSDAGERLSVCLQLADARQPPDYRAKIVRLSPTCYMIGRCAVFTCAQVLTSSQYCLSNRPN